MPPNPIDWSFIRRAAYLSMLPAVPIGLQGTLSAEEMDHVLLGLHPTGLRLLRPARHAGGCAKCAHLRFGVTRHECSLAGIALGRRRLGGSMPEPHEARQVRVHPKWPACELHEEGAP